jgi:hypothetical protein
MQAIQSYCLEIKIAKITQGRILSSRHNAHEV